MALYRTVSKIVGDFSRKSQIFQPPCILRPAEGVPLELNIGAEGQKTRMMGLSDRIRNLTIIFSRLVTIHQRGGRTDGRTDAQTDTGRQQRPRLRIASRGNY